MPAVEAGERQEMLVMGLLVFRLGRDKDCDRGLIETLEILMKGPLPSDVPVALFFEALQAVRNIVCDHNRVELLPALISLGASLIRQEWVNTADPKQLKMAGVALFHWVTMSLQRTPNGFQEDPDVMEESMEILVWLIQKFGDTEEDEDKESKSQSEDIMRVEDVNSEEEREKDRAEDEEEKSENIRLTTAPVEDQIDKNDERCKVGFSFWLLHFSPFPSQMVELHPALTLKHWKRICQILPQQKTKTRHQYISYLTTSFAIPLVREHLEAGNQQMVIKSFALLVPLIVALFELDHALYGPIPVQQREFTDAFTSLIQLSFSASDLALIALNSIQSLLLTPGIPQGKLPLSLMPLLCQHIGTNPKTDPMLWSNLALFCSTTHMAPEFIAAATTMILQVVGCALIAMHDPDHIVKCVMELAKRDKIQLKNSMDMLEPRLREGIQVALRKNAQLAAAAAPENLAAQAPKIELKLKFGG